MACHHDADHGAATHRLTFAHRRPDRLVGGDQVVGVPDRDDRTSGDLPGEPDTPVTGGAHRRAGCRREIHPAMPGKPALLRRVEPAHHRRRGDRCDKAGVVTERDRGQQPQQQGDHTELTDGGHQHAQRG